MINEKYKDELSNIKSVTIFGNNEEYLNSGLFGI